MHSIVPFTEIYFLNFKLCNKPTKEMSASVNHKTIGKNENYKNVLWNVFRTTLINRGKFLINMFFSSLLSKC